MNNILDEINSYLVRLFPLCRSITGEPNRITLKALQEIIPLALHEIPSGTKVYDWTIPDEWSVSEAWIKDINGNRIIDFKLNNLHLVSYSTPVNAEMYWDELKDHIYVHPTNPNVIPYRTNYYKRNWGFCVTRHQYEELESHNGPFSIFIDSKHFPGSLSFGEYLIPGESSKEVLISSYICHPSMANDSLSGVLLACFLARYISNLPSRRWSYRFAFVPETIGAIAYCFLNEKKVKEIDFGFVITTCGGPGKFSYKQSFDKNHSINFLIEEVFNNLNIDYDTHPFDIHGSDERQYSSQGFRINIASVFKDKYYEYPFYHTSADDLKYVNSKNINEALEIYKMLIHKLDKLKIYKNLQPNCEVMLSQYDLYPNTGASLVPVNKTLNKLDIILWLLYYCDGNLDLENIARRLNINESILEEIANELTSVNLLLKA